MKSVILSVALIASFTPAWTAVAAPFQDLDRVNDIVNQARELADGLTASKAATGNSVSGNARATQGVGNNPFARSPLNAPPADNARRPEVDVGNDAIRIQAGGINFDIPRTGTNGTRTYPNSDLAMRAARGGVANGTFSANVDSALKTASDFRVFSDAVRLFQQADYPGALTKIDQVKPAQGAAVIQQFHALCLFAEGDYANSAAIEYEVASKAPLFSWDQLRSYYSDQQNYARQYRELQTVANENRDDHSLRFLLGCHHLMLGHRDQASQEFEFVLTRIPQDPVVTRLLNVARQAPPLPMR